MVPKIKFFTSPQSLLKRQIHCTCQVVKLSNFIRCTLQQQSVDSPPILIQVDVSVFLIANKPWIDMSAIVKICPNIILLWECNHCHADAVQHTHRPIRNTNDSIMNSPIYNKSKVFMVLSFSTALPKGTS